MDVDEFCRGLEDYLCRKNDGHLIRIVGPSFELVRGWAEKGIPFKVACRGIDRYVERYYAKAVPRRRPVRIEFCEPDVLDVFDEWRRAVGVGVPDPTDAPAHRGPSLPEHLDRAISRLTLLRSGSDARLDAAIDRMVREIDGARAGARSLRGAARQALLDRLRLLDAELLDLYRSRCGDLQTLEREADAELAAFRDRMPNDAYRQAQAAVVDRLIREQARLPVLLLD